MCSEFAPMPPGGTAVSPDTGPGWGGTALQVPPGRGPRGVAFAPAVRGYPGGIADMAGNQDEYDADLSFDDDELWEPAAPGEQADVAEQTDGADPGAAAGEHGDAPAQAGPVTPEAGSPPPGQPLPAEPGSRPAGQSTPAPVSVWQQSAAAWQEAGIDWTRPATAGPRPAAGFAADDDPHTEPIPVLTADGSVRPARTPDKAGRPSAGTAAVAEAGLAAEVNRAAAEAGGQTAAETAAPPVEITAPPSVAQRAPGAAIASEKGAAAPGGTTQAKPAKQVKPGKKADPGKREKASPGPGPDGQVGPGRSRIRPGKRVAIVAVIAVVLVAGTLAGLGIARSGRPAAPEFTLVTPYPPTAAADTELAGPAGGATPLLGSLTGIAAAGRTVVAIGAEPSQPAPVPLLVYSTDGGHTWARAAVAGPGAG